MTVELKPGPRFSKCPTQKTESMKRYPKRLLLKGAMEAIEDTRDRPKTFGQCLEAELGTPDLPCPYVGCKYHLYLDVSPTTGNLQYNHVGKEPDEIGETCSLRVATEEGITLDATGDHMGITRERVRQIEAKSLVKLRVAKDGREAIRDHHDAPVDPWHRSGKVVLPNGDW